MAKKEIKKTRKAAQKVASTLTSRAEQALKDYEGAMNLLHHRKYSEAAGKFQEVIDAHPTEKEIADRCRLYLRICSRHTDQKVHPLKRPEDYFYQGVVESNRQQYDQAIDHLGRALKLSPGDDKVVYVMAAILALKGERDQALSSLREAIQLNTLNRAHAQQDPDFDALREDDEFRDLVYPSEH
jgi:tetratricopeptide (TPR) repeat protein